MAVEPPVTPKDAASLVILRGTGPATEVLMGRRRDNARFMPGVYVFPGGGLEEQDTEIASVTGATHPLIATAMRETWEETDILIGRPPADAGPSETVQNDFLSANREAGVSSMPAALTYFGRAITPADLPIRFDTRFFLCDAANVTGEARPIGELPDVSWVSVQTALKSDRVRGVSKFMLTEAMTLAAEPARLDDPNRAVRLYTYIDGINVIRRERQDDGLPR